MKLEHWITVITAIGVLIIISLIRRYGKNRFIKAIEARDIKQLEKVCESKLTRYSVPPFNIEYGKMTCYLLNGDEKKAIIQFEQLLKMRKKKNQELDLCLKGFRYFVSLNDKRRSKEMLDKIIELGNETQIHEAQIMYDVYIAKNSEHIEEITTRYEECADGSETIYAEMLYLMYKHKGDYENAKKYQDIATGVTKREKRKDPLNDLDDLDNLTLDE